MFLCPFFDSSLESSMKSDCCYSSNTLWKTLISVVRVVCHTGALYRRFGVED